MTTIAWNNGPIFRSGAVGTGQACCCKPKVEKRICSCGALAPLEVIVTVTVGNRISQLPDEYDECLDADFKAFIEGSYVLALDPLSTPSALLYYMNSGLSGDCQNFYCSTDISAALYCSSGPFGSHAQIGFRICDTSRLCFQSIDATVYFFSAHIPNACSFGPLRTFTRGGQIEFSQKTPLYSCFSQNFVAYKRYEATFGLEIVY